MLVPFRKALLAGALLVAFSSASAASAAETHRWSLDPAIPHHAAILDTLAKIEQDPSNADLQNDLGCLIAWDGFWRDALKAFDKASELAPKDSRPHFNAGLVEALHGSWGGARSRFRKAVKVDPGNWPAWWMLGFAQEMLGNLDAAVDAYARSLRVDTSLFDPKVNPFAAATRLKNRTLLATLERRRVEAAIPFTNQLSSPSRVASFFQAKGKPEKATVTIEEPPRTGPVVTSVPPSTTAPPRTMSAPAPLGGDSATTRRRRGYTDRTGRDPDAPVEVAPEGARTAPEAAKTPVPAPGPGFGEGSGAPGSGTAGAAPGTVRRPGATMPTPGPGTGGPGGVPEPTPVPE